MQTKNIGKVIALKDGIVVADGLSDVGFNEIVLIQTKSGVTVEGLALSLNKTYIGMISLADVSIIEEGDTVEATGREASINVSDKILGRVINALGQPQDGKGKLDDKGATAMPLEKIAPDVLDRQDVKRPLQTGIMAVDSMIPIGRGQRELIIGDRQTGKTAIAIDTIINQKRAADELGMKQVKCIYVAIGQKQSTIRQITQKLKQTGAMAYTTVVIAGASDPVSLQYIAPLAGTAIAEYFAGKGDDVLIVYDDLTKHAWAYREISLLLKRPPGREAYPGDIFYLHSSLLERSVQFSEDMGGGSITSLPIIETQAGDVSAYIPTNIISITDGQIYLETDLFNAGIRPAINIGISVSRVGGDAQLKPMKQIAGKLRLDLAQHKELSAFSQFGSDLDEETRSKLDRGSKMMELLKQEQYQPLLAGEQIMLVYAGTNGYLDDIPTSEVNDWTRQLQKYLDTNHKKLMEEVIADKKLSPKLEQKLEVALAKFKYSTQ